MRSQVQVLVRPLHFEGVDMKKVLLGLAMIAAAGVTYKIVADRKEAQDIWASATDKIE